MSNHSFLFFGGFMKEIQQYFENLTDKEQRILSAAIEIFCEKGYGSSTTNEIAKKAEVAEGTVFKYFKNKKGILKSILIHSLDVLASKVIVKGAQDLLLHQDGKDLKEILTHFFNDRLSIIDKLFPMFRVVIVEALYHDDIREVLYQKVMLPIQIVSKAFHEEMLSKGLMRKEITHDMMIRTFIGQMAVLIIQNKVFDKQFKTENLKAEIQKSIDVIIDGIGTK